MLKNMLFVSVFLVTAFTAMSIMAQDACEGQVGAAFGLCNAYCEAMDCDSADPQASANACNNVYDSFFTQTGSPPPCEISCPCFTLDDLQTSGAIASCGDNIANFVDTAGIFYDNGDIACSGTTCAEPGTRSCALRQDGDLFFELELTQDEDESCRTFILATCPTPNAVDAPQAVTAPTSNGSLFIDQ